MGIKKKQKKNSQCFFKRITKGIEIETAARIPIGINEGILHEFQNELLFKKGSRSFQRNGPTTLEETTEVFCFLLAKIIVKEFAIEISNRVSKKS